MKVSGIGHSNLARLLLLKTVPAVALGTLRAALEAVQIHHFQGIPPVVRNVTL